MGDEPEHPTPTRRNGYRYLFVGKHHGGGTSSDAQWLKAMSRDDEFAVFDNADWHETTDHDLWLYGVWRENDQLRDLGVRYEQVAAFPYARPGQAWHGYPCWPLRSENAGNRKGERMRPTKLVFEKLERSGLINRQERKRLWKGNHA